MPYIVDNTGDNPNEWDGDGFDTVITSASFTLNFLAEIELVQTSNAAGTDAIDLRGNLYTQTLIGNASANRQRAGEGTDTLIGNDGNDTLRGDEHADMLDGGPGFDIASYEGSAAVQVNLALGQGLGSDAQGDVLVGIEGVIGSAQGDQLTGDAAGNLLNGGGGPDVLTGGGGTDLFQFNVGQANGDTVVDFEGGGPAAGDTLQFIGYGAGATFTQIDATHWQVNYNVNTQHEVITILNGAVFDQSDLFV